MEGIQDGKVGSSKQHIKSIHSSRKRKETFGKIVGAGSWLDKKDHLKSGVLVVRQTHNHINQRWGSKGRRAFASSTSHLYSPLHNIYSLPVLATSAHSTLKTQNWNAVVKRVKRKECQRNCPHSFLFLSDILFGRSLHSQPTYFSFDKIIIN